MFLVLISCGNQKDRIQSNKSQLEASDLGCKDGGACLPDHSCCIVSEELKGDTVNI